MYGKKQICQIPTKLVNGRKGKTNEINFLK